MFKRILMNQADASPGNGAEPAAAPVDAPPPANGAPPAANPLESVVANLASQIDTIAKAMNSLHAEGRRVREGKPAKEPAAKESPDDPIAILALRDSFDDATSELTLTKGQKQLLRGAVMGSRPENVDAFVSDFASKAGWLTTPAPAAAPNATGAPALKATNEQPITNRGTPPAPKVSLEPSEFAKWPQADRDAFLREKGPVEYRKALMGSLKGKPVNFRG